MCFLTQRSRELLLGDSRVTMHDACAMTNMHSSDLFSDARSNECCALLSSWAMEQRHHFHPHYWHKLMRHLASTSFAPPTQRRMRRRTALQPLKPPLLSLQAEKCCGVVFEAAQNKYMQFEKDPSSLVFSRSSARVNLRTDRNTVHQALIKCPQS